MNYKMKEFFIDRVHDMPFIQFGQAHMVCMLSTFLVIILIYVFRNNIRNLKKKTKNIILYTCASIMLANMAVYYFTHYYWNFFDFKTDLPIHLCYISGILFMFAILSGNKILLKFTYFLSFIGPLPAIIWPGLYSTVNSFNFYNYFISHHFFIASSLFSFFAYKIRIEKKDPFILFFVTNLVFISIIFFNKVFSTNYMFSDEIPDRVQRTLPFLKYFHPILITEVMGTCIIIALYFLARKTNKELNKTEQIEIA